MSKGFFESSEEQSRVKARIVQKYFAVWSSIVVPTASQRANGKIAYIDLYSGPGRYKDGTPSTPLLVLQEAIKNKLVRNALVALFNDINMHNTATLQSEINKLPGIELLKYKPKVCCHEVGNNIEEFLKQISLVPSFTFIDPFGYKGLSRRLVSAVIKDWGCDCIFFFNYNRINAGLSNDTVKSRLDAIFGEERVDSLRQKVEGESSTIRQGLILQELSDALEEIGAKYLLPFCFKNERGRLTHYLIFVTKHFKGYDVMKDIMHKESSTEDQSVASFAYSLADERMPRLFDLTRPLDELDGMLLEQFSGQTLTMSEIYKKHSVGRPYIRKHYKDVLKKLEQNRKIKVTDPDSKKRSGFPERLIVEFPKSKE